MISIQFWKKSTRAFVVYVFIVIFEIYNVIYEEFQSDVVFQGVFYTITPLYFLRCMCVG